MAAPIVKYGQNILTNVHSDLEGIGVDICIACGQYLYYHYGCDGLDDRGWGCGYRTLQSLCSWVKHQQRTGEHGNNLAPSHDVPSIPELQDALIAMGDKPEKFKESKEWIGSFEACLCLDYLYNVPCKMLHIRAGCDLPGHLEDLSKHLREYGSPVMMGGDSDSSSKCILGVCTHPQALLVMDPHYYGPTESNSYLQEEGWVKWRSIDEFKEHSFYNMCLPQLKCRDLK